jgi:hypothetical protein
MVTIKKVSERICGGWMKFDVLFDDEGQEIRNRDLIEITYEGKTVERRYAYHSGALFYVLPSDLQLFDKQEGWEHYPIEGKVKLKVIRPVGLGPVPPMSYGRFDFLNDRGGFK